MSKRLDLTVEEKRLRHSEQKRVWKSLHLDKNRIKTYNKNYKKRKKAGLVGVKSPDFKSSGFNARQRETRARIDSYKAERGCVVCGEKDPIILDLDHIDPKTKSFSISQRSYLPFEQLIDELAKCQVLCCNCHRRKTCQDRKR